MVETHKVVKSFTLEDIIKEDCDAVEFLKLCSEISCDIPVYYNISHIRWGIDSKLSNYPTLLKNLHWVPKGCVEEIKVLKNGMHLILEEEYCNSEYVIIKNSLINIESGNLWNHRLFKTSEELNKNCAYLNCRFFIKEEDCEN